MGPLVPRAPRAFTLVEVTLAIAITGILLIGMGSALLMTMKAADMGADGNASAIAASDSLSVINAELAVALSIGSATQNDISFTVPDRDGDAVPERIQYTWSGSAGDPILRSYNGSAAVPVILNVRSAAVAVAERPAARAVESAEMVLAQCNSPTGATITPDTVNTTNFDAQYVRLVLPAGAQTCKITKLSLFLGRSGGGDKTLMISLRAADAALKPTGAALASVTFTTGSIGSDGWVEFAIGPVADLAANRGICIQIEGTQSGATLNVFRAQNGTNQPYNTHYLNSIDSGATWSPPKDVDDLRFILTGTTTSLVEP